MFDFEFQPIEKDPTLCCSLCLISAKNYHSLEYIQQFINQQRKQANSRIWHNSGTNRHGQQNLMCIVSPSEDDLEKNLISCGFVLVANNLKRRTGYPPGLLKMYLLTL